MRSGLGSFSYPFHGTSEIIANDLRPGRCCATNPMKPWYFWKLRTTGAIAARDGTAKSACMDNVWPSASDLSVTLSPDQLTLSPHSLAPFSFQLARLTLGPVTNSSTSQCTSFNSRRVMKAIDSNGLRIVLHFTSSIQALSYWRPSIIL